MQTKFVILASIFGVITGLSFSTNQNVLLSVGTALVASVFSLAAYFSKDKKDKQIEEIHNFATNQETTHSQPMPLKIVILNSADAYKATYEGDPVEWNKFILALITNPFFPEKLRTTIQSQSIESFLLIDLENKKLINPPPKDITDLKTKAVALVHKGLMADLPIEVRATIISKKYIDE